MFLQLFILLYMCACIHQVSSNIKITLHCLSWLTVQKVTRTYEEVELPEDKEEKGTVDYTGKTLTRKLHASVF